MNKAPIDVLIADDEHWACRRLRALLGAQADMRIVGQCHDGASAAHAIGQLAPHLVFLDVDMPVLSGLEVVAQVGAARMPATVFVTAHDHYAVAAFDANAVDYLVKPFDQCRFQRTLERVRQRLGGGQRQAMPDLAPMAREAAPAIAERMLVREGDAQYLVRTADILYLTAEANYVRLHTALGQHQMRATLAAMQERLDPERFRRIHRSHIINLDHVRKILPWFGGDRLVMMADGARLTLSRTHRQALAQFD